MNKVATYFMFLMLSSCTAIRSTDYVADEVYHHEAIQHRFNASAVLSNPNVAMPESDFSYYDESYANSIRPDYARRLKKFESDPAPDTQASDSYAGDAADYSPPGYFQEPNTLPWNRPSVGMGVSIGTGFMVGGGNPYYSPYRPYSAVIVPSSSTSRERSGYNPNVANSRVQGSVRSTPDKYLKSISPGKTQSSGDRSYRSRSTSNPGGVYSNPGYYSPSNSRGSYSPGGTVRGVYRR